MNDVDGDGRIELLVCDANNTNAYAVSVFKNVSAVGSISFLSKIDLPTVASAKVMATDFSADGRADLLISGSALRGVIYPNRVGAPNIMGFTPASAGAGTVVTLSGSNFTGVTEVSFGGVPAASFTVVNTSTITAVINTGASGDIRIKAPLGTAILSGFVFAPNPVITFFRPSVATTATTVTITGANFTNATGVRFGGQPAASFTIVSPAVITALVGAGSSGNVTILFPADSVSVAGFIFSNGPYITGLSTLSGSAGTPVTISGANFNTISDSNVVYFGAVKAQVVSAASNALTVLVPPGATYHTISVTTNRFTVYSQLPFMPTFAGGNLTSASFSKKLDLELGNTSYYAEAGDWNNDGKVDLAATSTDGKKVSVFQNNGAAGTISFLPKTDYPLNGSADGLGVGDFNGDGISDMAIANFNISVFKSMPVSGIIAFAPKVDFSAIAYHNLSVGDFNLDGRPDLVTTSDTKLTVSQNTSSAGVLSFGPAVATVVSTADQSDLPAACAGDFDGDGKPDVAMVSYYSDGCFIYKNTGTANAPSFGARLGLNTGYRPISITCGDVNSDGKLDLVVANYGANSVSVFLNISTNGALAFASKLDFATGSYPRCVSLADLNGDGKLEIIVVNSIAATITVLENKTTNGGALTFGRIDYPTVSFPQYIAIADFDGDAKPDLAVVEYTGKVSILRNTVGEQQLSVCAGITTTITANLTGSIYQWQVNKGNGFINISNNGTYSGASTPVLQITNPDTTLTGSQYRCNVNTINGVIVNLSVLPYPAAPLISISTNIICQGSFQILRSSAPSGNQWYKNGVLLSNETATAYAAMEAGNYTVVSTINGCSSPVSNTISLTVASAVTPSVSINTSGCNGSAASFTATVTNAGSGGTINWFVNNVSSGTGISFTLNNPVNGTVVYAGLLSTAVCANSLAVFSSQIIVNCITTAIPNVDYLELFKISPNPTHGVLFIKLKLRQLKKLSFKITDGYGKTVYTTAPENAVGNVTKQINIKGKGSGVYYLETTLGDKRFTEKFVIAR